MDITLDNVTADSVPELALTARPRAFSFQSERELMGRIIEGREVGAISVYDLAACGVLDDPYIRSLIEAAR